jgi:hypothetical protein
MVRIPSNMIHIVYDIYHSSTDYDERRKYYITKYPEFVKEYTELFEMLCKPRFNFDKFIEISYNLTISSGKKRKRHSDDLNSDEEQKKLAPEVLIPKLQKMFNEQKKAVEYFT